MDSANRLQVTSKVTYYGGWILAFLGAIVHFGFGAAKFLALGLPQRNLFEASIMLFLISTVSALRALTKAKTS